MKRNFLPAFIGINLSKAEFCFCTGCTPYRLRTILNSNYKHFEKLGYNRWDKMLMPNVVMELLAMTGLRIDVDLYSQYVAGCRGVKSPIETRDV